MSRVMIDAADPAQVLSGYTLVAGYLTGTPGDAWRGHHADVWIDQASTGAPRYDANVMDVEPQCYSVADVPGWTSRCTAPRPTVYCDRSDYPGVRALWRGDIWLAAPGGVNLTDYPGVIAVQDTFTANYDLSTVYDSTWPLKKAIPPPPPPVTGDDDMAYSGMLLPAAKRFVPFPAGSCKVIMLMCDFDLSPQSVRVAVHSKATGYSEIREFAITGHAPNTLAFAHDDVDGVSLVSNATLAVGWTIALCRSGSAAGFTFHLADGNGPRDRSGRTTRREDSGEGHGSEDGEVRKAGVHVLPTGRCVDAAEADGESAHGPRARAGLLVRAMQGMARDQQATQETKTKEIMTWQMTL